MLDSGPMTTILPVRDPERARRFYQEQLGLAYQGQSDDGQHRFAVGGGILALQESTAGPGATTEVSFEVPDVAAAIAALQGRGVRFEDYDLPGLKTVDHVAVLGSLKAAWFLDPEGNTLCVHQVLP